MVIKAISEPCTCIHIVDVQCTFCSCTYIYIQKILYLHNVHVFMYMFPIMVIKVHYGPCACIQFIMVISVTRTHKDLEYSDTNEIIKSGNITR